jgi:hypothetical protein
MSDITTEQKNVDTRVNRVATFHANLKRNEREIKCTFNILNTSTNHEQ